MANLAAGALSPVELCLPEILISIFEMIVTDEMMLNFPPKYISGPLQKEPIAAVALALVCRKWKNIIYNTRALWATIFINSDIFFGDISSQENPMVRHQSMLQLEHAKWHAQMANGAPMLLYLLQLPISNIDPTSIHNILQVAPNLQKLRIYNSPGHNKSSVLFFSRAWPELLNLHEAIYLVRFGTLVEVDLSPHFQGMPHLTTLWMNECNISLPFCTGIPLLPVLKYLRLQAPTFTGLTVTRFTPAFNFLSHCPQLEELILIQYLAAMRYDPDQNDRLPIRLASLRKVTTRSGSVMTPFTDDHIITPVLEEFDLLRPPGQRRHSDFQKLLKFFQTKARSLTALRASIEDPSECKAILVLLVHLTFLKLFVDRDVSSHLAALCMPIEANDRAPVTCLPSLLTFHLELKESALSPEHFISFVRARCIPVNTERVTEAGCRALDMFILEASTTLINELMETKEWEAASVWERAPATFHLRWEAYK